MTADGIALADCPAWVLIYGRAPSLAFYFRVCGAITTLTHDGGALLRWLYFAPDDGGYMSRPEACGQAYTEQGGIAIKYGPQATDWTGYPCASGWPADWVAVHEYGHLLDASRGWESYVPGCEQITDGPPRHGRYCPEYAEPYASVYATAMLTRSPFSWPVAVSGASARVSGKPAGGKGPPTERRAGRAA